MLTKRVLYFDWDKAQDDMKRANAEGFDSYMVYSPNEKGWAVTFKTLEARVCVL